VIVERFVVLRESDIGIAVVGVQAVARKHGFSERQIERLGTAVSELARNIIRYASSKGGDILVQQRSQSSGLELTVQARDNGPGIGNIEAAMADSFSTGGGLGLGLPGVKRMVDGFGIESVVGQGTIVTISMLRRP
jgi:serine/threonine-protein kinase RsbT